jgi:hypothetical protein
MAAHPCAAEPLSFSEVPWLHADPFSVFLRQDFDISNPHYQFQLLHGLEPVLADFNRLMLEACCSA